MLLRILSEKTDIDVVFVQTQPRTMHSSPSPRPCKRKREGEAESALGKRTWVLPALDSKMSIILNSFRVQYVFVAFWTCAH